MKKKKNNIRKKFLKSDGFKKIRNNNKLGGIFNKSKGKEIEEVLKENPELSKKLTKLRIGAGVGIAGTGTLAGVGLYKHLKKKKDN